MLKVANCVVLIRCTMCKMINVKSAVFWRDLKMGNTEVSQP